MVHVSGLTLYCIFNGSRMFTFVLQVDVPDFLCILDIVKPSDGEVFVDLGEVVGKAVLAAACGFSEFFEVWNDKFSSSTLEHYPAFRLSSWTSSHARNELPYILIFSIFGSYWYRTNVFLMQYADYAPACPFFRVTFQCRGIEIVKSLSDAATYHLGTLSALLARP